eukprot:Rmarinus@m.2207
MRLQRLVGDIFSQVQALTEELAGYAPKNNNHDEHDFNNGDISAGPDSPLSDPSDSSFVPDDSSDASSEGVSFEEETKHARREKLEEVTRRITRPSTMVKQIGLSSAVEFLKRSHFGVHDGAYPKGDVVM